MNLKTMSVVSESEVFEEVLENVEERGWDPFVHVPDAHVDSTKTSSEAIHGTR